MINKHNLRTRKRNTFLHLPKLKLQFGKNGSFAMDASLYYSFSNDMRKCTGEFENKVKILSD